MTSIREMFATETQNIDCQANFVTVGGSNYTRRVQLSFLETPVHIIGEGFGILYAFLKNQ